ncbi:MAG: hypothetical protein O7H39_06425 [Gammaproteobacteria bacterium]|nr:hypothetical protein [Gammaproteobacteria bacterium]
MTERTFDRSDEDIGNILNMEHINLTVPDQGMAALFYVSGLGLTRDPYIDFGTFNMWINCGEQQFHLPKRDAQKFRGHIGVVVPNLEDLKSRFKFIEKPMKGTEHAWEEKDDHIQVTCPWGNDIRVYGPDKFEGVGLGIPYAEVMVAPGSAEGITRFYTEVFDTPARTIDDNEGPRSEVMMGTHQWLTFRETDAAIPDYDGHHIAIYVANFSRPHGFLAEKELITEESDQHQYRFQAIVDPDSGETLVELEHEVRSVKHPMLKRNLLNRNPAQTFFNYREGRDAYTPE